MENRPVESTHVYRQKVKRSSCVYLHRSESIIRTKDAYRSKKKYKARQVNFRTKRQFKKPSETNIT